MNQEANVTQRIYELIIKAGLGSLKRVSKQRSVTTSEFRNTVTSWFGQEIPWPLVEPDLILVFEDVRKIIDDVMIVAIEIKYFKQAKDLDKRLRQSFREVGQPLRNLIFGVDSTALWHIFSPDIEEHKIHNYVNVIEEVIRKLNLPLVYLATARPNDTFKVYKPFELDKYDLQSWVIWVQNLCADHRNPIMNRDTDIRRRALKLALRIPS